MKKTFREKVLSHFLRIAKKHPYLKLPALACITILLAGYYFVQFVGDNSKRLASAACVMVFFVVSSSFSFPVFAGDTGFVSKTAPTVGTAAQDVSYTEESDVQLAENAVDSLQKSGSDRMKAPEDIQGTEWVDSYTTGEFCAQEMTEEYKYTSDEILEGNRPAERSAMNGEEEDKGNNQVFDQEDWRLVLVNKQHPIPDNYTFQLGTIKGNKRNMQCDERIIDDLLKMLQDAKNEGINLVICSPYRDLKRQELLFNRKIDHYMDNGMSYMEAYKTASLAVTVPGASEHQIGLALDIVSDGYTSLDEGFGETPAGKWLAEHGCEYGFILRYPAGKEYITSIEYEPWHFRYVGKEAATIITREGITLEEFTDNYL